MKHYIYYHHNLPEHLAEFKYNNLSWLPKLEQLKLSNLQRDLDKMLGIYGKLLLRYGLKELGYSPDLISALQYTEQKRPYLDIPWEFNITHCADLVAIVFAEKVHVGLDVENNEKVDITDFQGCFTMQEWYDIISAENQYARFLYFWTRKEAVLKGIGSGLLIHPSLFEAIDEIVLWDNVTWNLHSIETKKDHVCFLATEDPEAEIEITEIRDLSSLF
jgi:4'-phosphopantetheinyl transferase